MAKDFERLGATFAALEAPGERKRMLVIVNPFATAVDDRLRHLVIGALRGRFDVDAVDTNARGHAAELAAGAAADTRYDVVVSFGGDGTANEIANGLAGSDTPMTCLPGGATNVLGKMLGIPSEIVDATEHLLRLADDWRPRRIDLGTVNGRGFTCSSGYGLDAAVGRRIDARPELKARFGEPFFVYAAVATFLLEYVVKPPQMEVAINGRTDRAVTTIVQNGDPFTYLGDRPVRLADGAALDSGTLAGVALHRAGPVDLPGVMFRLLSTRRGVGDHKRVLAFRDLTSLRCASADGRPIPLHVDGDWIGDVMEAEYSIRPRALAVIA